jgi:hypothetical protein
MKDTEFLRRHRPPDLVFDEAARATIIDRVNQRGFFVTVRNRMYRATIAGTRLKFPQVIIHATGQTYQITWQKAHLLSRNCITLKFL